MGDGTVRKRVLTAMAGVYVVSVLGGCVKHEETITVSPDGVVHLKIEVAGDREDMENGAPALARAPGWEFHEHLVIKEDDDQEICRRIETTIPAGHPIPATYPTADSDGQALVIQHPTTLIVERRRGDTYYHFRRVFEPRPWAFVNYWRNIFSEEYGDIDPDEMGREQTVELVEKLLGVGRRKELALINAAWRTMDEPWPQDVRLAVYDAVSRAVSDVDMDRLVDLLESGEKDDDEVGDELDALTRRIEEQVAEETRDAIRESGISERRADSFQALLQRERRRFVITEDYQDEEWDIRLEMPGTLLGHNGDEIVDGRVRWELKGDMFYDRQVELLATSMVPRGGIR